MVEQAWVSTVVISAIAVLSGVGFVLLLRSWAMKLNTRLLAIEGIMRATPAIKEAAQEVINALSLHPLGLHFPVFLGGPSIDSFHARCLVEELLAHPPVTVVEIGSGTSTILIARVMRLVCSSGYTHIAVDHDPYFLELTKRYAELNGLAERIDFRCCPLGHVPSVGLDWYSGLIESLGDRRVDLLVVDGPPAYQTEGSTARYPALPLLHPHLADRCTIILDDANRPGERAVLERWVRECPEFTVRHVADGKGVAILTRSGSASSTR
jgi:hypothetical protein